MKIKKLFMGHLGHALIQRFLYVQTWFLRPQRLIVLLQASCPYVTSVGATQMNPGSTIDDPEVAAMANLSLGPFYSGGGFSNVFPSVRLLFI